MEVITYDKLKERYYKELEEIEYLINKLAENAELNTYTEQQTDLLISKYSAVKNKIDNLEDVFKPKKQILNG